MSDGLPPWALAVGAVTGFMSFIFVVVDRLALGRPLVTIQRTGYNTRNIMCRNSPKEDVILTRVRVTSKHVAVAAGDHYDQIAEAVSNIPFMMIIPAGGTCEFPLIVRPGDLLDEDAKRSVPFVVIVSWRKTRSMWLPQFPVFLF